MARTRHKILVAVATIAKRLGPEPQLARGQDDGAAVGGHRSSAASTAPPAGLGLPNTHLLLLRTTVVRGRRPLLPLRPGGWPFGASCCRRAVGSAKMGCRLRCRGSVGVKLCRLFGQEKTRLEGYCLMELRAVPFQDVCLLASVLHAASKHSADNRVPGQKQGRDAALIAANNFRASP